MIKAIIFDMDGVLIDSVEIGLRVRKRILKQYNVDLEAVPDPQGEGHRAASMSALLASVKSHHGIQIDHDEYAKLAKEHMREELHGHGVSVDPSLITFLEELKQHNIICAIASSGMREGVDAKMKILGIRQYFSFIATGDDVKEHKPNPEVYLYTMEKLHLSPNVCVIFEDSLTGVQAGLASGCKVIGFAQYNPSSNPLPGVIATIKSWDEISYKQLKRLLASAD